MIYEASVVFFVFILFISCLAGFIQMLLKKKNVSLFQKLQTIFRLCLLYFQKAEPLKTLKGTEAANSVREFQNAHTLIPYETQKTRSVLLICLSFLVLMGASLVWIVFYYVKRARLMHSKDNLTRRMLSAAHTALAKIPVRRVKPEDLQKTLEEGGGDDCVICFDSFKIQELIRILPCRHEYHKSCIDPWLLEHRTCPMCKLDILKYYGFVFTGSQESILQVEADDDDEQNSESEQEEIEESSSPIRGLNLQPEIESFTHEDDMTTANSPTELIDPFESCPGECVVPIPAQNEPIPEKTGGESSE